MPNDLRTSALPPAHEIMARVFDTAEKVKRLARTCGVSDNHAYKWLRDGGTGAPSDLDRLCRIIFLVLTWGDVEGAGLIADYVREAYVSARELSAEPYRTELERVADSIDLVRKATAAAEALSLGTVTTETVSSLVELRDKSESVMARLYATPAAAAEMRAG